MKILMMTEKQDIFYHALIQSLNVINTPMAHADFSLPFHEIEKFDPDIIIHNGKEASKIDYKNSITISINEIDHDNCFSLRDSQSKNFIKPFIKLTNENFYNEKYKSDAIYVGNPSMLPECIVDLQNDPNISFKIINSMPIPITGFCGGCAFEDYKKFFHMSKCSLLDKSDSNLSNYTFKLLDVIYAGGNPVLHKEDDQFICDIKDAINGKSFRDDFMSVDEIKNDHTNHNRMSEIFSKIGLDKLSQLILKGKGK
jgi:hypothetical protein